MTSGLPRGLRVLLDPRTIVAAEGSVLIGGSPLTAVRLSPAAFVHVHESGVEVTDADSAHLADRLLATNLAQPDLIGVPSVDTADITVVIPVRDRAEELGRALAALAGLRCVVVDDASVRPDAVARAAHDHGATLVSLAANIGPAGARNAGLARVSTPFVAFVDSDIEVSPRTLTRLARHFIDPAVAMAGPKIIGRAHGLRPRWFERYDAAASSLTLGDTPAVVRPRAAVAWLPSACLIARTQVVRDQMHGFDATMRVGEDVDLVWRLVAAGQRVRYDPTVLAAHATRASLRGWLGRKFVYGTGGAPLAARHRAAVAPAVLSPTPALAGAALLARSRWSMPLTALALVAGARAVRRHLTEEGVPDAAAAGRNDGLGRHERDLIATRIAVRGLGWSIRQESALLLRHWWPFTVLGLAHPAVRRAVASALVVDSAVAAWELRHADRLPSPAGVFLARRLDDLAYGAGLWSGALHARSLTPLAPRRR